MSRAAERILTKSLADIEAGNWCQKELGAVQYEDNALLDYFESAEYSYHGAPVKTMACAVGLLSLYGDKGLETLSFEYGGKTYSFTTNLQYPTNESPKPIRDAVDALFDAIPVKSRRELIKEARTNSPDILEEWNDEAKSYLPIPVSAFDTNQKQVILVNYNDRETTTQKKALQWFGKALTTVQTANAERAAARNKKTTTTANLKTALKGA